MQALDAGGEGDGGHSKGLDIASLVHRYGRSFVHSNPDVALEYYMRVGCHKDLMPLWRHEMCYRSMGDHVACEHELECRQGPCLRQSAVELLSRQAQMSAKIGAFA